MNSTVLLQLLRPRPKLPKRLHNIPCSQHPPPHMLRILFCGRRQLREGAGVHISEDKVGVIDILCESVGVVVRSMFILSFALGSWSRAMARTDADAVTPVNTSTRDNPRENLEGGV